MKSPEMLQEFLSNGDRQLIFERNRSLIEFYWFEDLDDMLYKSGATCSVPSPDIQKVREEFVKRDFSSMINEKYWPKFSKSFETLAARYN